MTRRQRRVLKDQIRAAMRKVIPDGAERMWVVLVADPDTNFMSVHANVDDEKLVSHILGHAAANFTGATPTKPLTDADTVPTALTLSERKN